MLEKQLAREGVVRERVRALDDKATRAFSVLRVCTAAVPDSLEVRRTGLGKDADRWEWVWL